MLHLTGTEGKMHKMTGVLAGMLENVPFWLCKIV